MSASGWVLECFASGDPEPVNCAGFILLIVQAPQSHLQRSSSREQQLGMEGPFSGWMSKHWCTSVLLALQPAQPALGIQGSFTLMCWGEKLYPLSVMNMGDEDQGKIAPFFHFFHQKLRPSFQCYVQVSQYLDQLHRKKKPPITMNQLGNRKKYTFIPCFFCLFSFSFLYIAVLPHIQLNKHLKVFNRCFLFLLRCDIDDALVSFVSLYFGIYILN